MTRILWFSCEQDMAPPIQGRQLFIVSLQKFLHYYKTFCRFAFSFIYPVFIIESVMKNVSKIKKFQNLEIKWW